MSTASKLRARKQQQGSVATTENRQDLTPTQETGSVATKKQGDRLPKSRGVSKKQFAEFQAWVEAQIAQLMERNAPAPEAAQPLQLPPDVLQDLWDMLEQTESTNHVEWTGDHYVIKINKQTGVEYSGRNLKQAGPKRCDRVRTWLEGVSQ